MTEHSALPIRHQLVRSCSRHFKVMIDSVLSEYVVILNTSVQFELRI